MKHGNPTLYLVGTPIGNLEDITLRSLRILKEVDIIFAEDTRRTVKLLNHYEIKTALRSMPADAEKRRIPDALDALRRGLSIAVVSDAGMPSSSDPGAEMLSAVRAAGFPVAIIPGPSAPSAAMALSGIPGDRYIFEGFLPRTGQKRANRIESFQNETRTVIFFESPHRVRETLTELLRSLGPRRIVIARELTKIHEEIITSTLDKTDELNLIDKGEYTIIIEGCNDEKTGNIREEDAERTAEALVREGVEISKAAKAISRVFGVSKNALYRKLLGDAEA